MLYGKQKTAIKADNRRLNSYETLYNAVANKPLFVQEDWTKAANQGVLDAYVADLMQSDTINVEDYYDKYNIEYADSDTRRLALHNEVSGNRMNVDTERTRTAQKADGSVVEEKYLASDYNYNLNIIRQHNDYNQQIKYREIEQNMKDSMSAGDHIAGVASGIGTSLAYGSTNAIDNLTSVVGGVIEFFKADEDKLGGFVEGVSSDEYRYFSEFKDELIDFERRYTSIRDIDGNYTNWGKYLGGIMTSLGEYLPSMFIGMGATKAGIAAGEAAKTARVGGELISKSTYYIGMGAGNVKDAYDKFESVGADVNAASILANATLKTAAQFGVEYGLGKLFKGKSNFDKLVFGGETPKQVVAKTLTGQGVKSLALDFLKEGTEEVFQDTTDFMINQAFSAIINEYHEFEGLSWQSVIDAFFIGGFASLSANVFKIISDNVDVNVRGVIGGKAVINVDGKKLNPIASWQYGLNMQSFEESLSIVEDIVKSYHDRNNSIDVKYKFTDKDRDIVQKAVQENYAAYRMITSIYNEIGEERFKAADKLLTEMTEMIKSGKFDVLESIDYAEKVSSQLSELSKKALINAMEELKNAGVTEIKETAKPDTEIKGNVDETSTLTEKTRKLKEELGVKELNVSDGSIAKVAGDVAIIDDKKLDRESIAQMLKHFAINKLITHTMDTFSNQQILKTFKDKYVMYSGMENPTDKEVVTALLFDKGFFTATLLDGNKDVYKLLSYFVQLTKDVKVGRAYDAVYKKTIENAVEHWCEELTEYCIIHSEAQPSMFTFAITDKKKREEIENRIKRERYGSGIFNRAIDGKLTDIDKRVLEKHIRSLYNETHANELIKMLFSNNKTERSVVMSDLVNRSQNVFNNGYDGLTYMPDDSIPNRVFNNYLKTLGLTIKTLVNKSSLTESDITYIVNNIGELNYNNIRKFRAKQFENYSGGNYSYTLNGKPRVIYNGKIMGFVDENDEGLKFWYNQSENSTGLNYVDSRSKIVHDFLKVILKDEFKNQSHYYTFTDVVYDPNLLDERIINNIKKFVEKRTNETIDNITPEHVYVFLKSFLNTKHDNKTLVMDKSGDVLLADMTSMKYIDKGIKEIKEDTKLSEIFKENYVPHGVKLIYVDDFKSGDGKDDIGVQGQYIYWTNKNGYNYIDNAIYVRRSLLNGDIETLKITIFHELQHAIQEINNLNNGNISNFYDYLSDADRKKIISEVKKYMPDSVKFLNENEIINLINNYAYQGTGESLAFGVERENNIVNFVPVLSRNDIGKNRIVTFPWGSSYELKNYSNKKSTKTSFVKEKFYSSNFVNSPRNASSSNVFVSERIKINKDELAEDDPRAKDFVSTERSPNAKYIKRFYKLNKDGTQKLDNQGKPIYRYVYPEDVDRTRGRYVSKRKYEGTNLEYFNKKYTPLQMTKEMQKFVLGAKDLDPILQERINGSQAGTLTEHDVMDYFRSANKIDNKTFNAINDAFFKNQYIKSFKELQDKIDITMAQSWAFGRLVKNNENMKAYEKMLHSESVDVSFLVEAIENNKDADIAKQYGDIYSRFDQFGPRSLDIKDEYARITYMKKYDGTIESEERVAATVRYVAIHNYNITHKTPLPQEVVSDAYEELIEDLPMNKGAMIDAIKNRELARKAKELVAKGENYRDHVMKLLQEADELVEKLESMSTLQIRMFYENEGGIGKVVAEGVIAENTGEYVEVPKDVPKITSRAIVNNISGYLRTIRRNLNLKELNNFVNEHSDLFDKNLKLKKELYQDKIPNKTRPGYHYRNKSAEELIDLLDRIAEIKDDVLNSVRMTKDALNIKNKHDKEVQRTINKLIRENEKLKEQIKLDKVKSNPVVTEFIVENEVVSIKTDVEIPTTLKRFLQTQYEEKARTNVKNLSSESERHVKLISKSFFENNDEKLNSLTQGDVDTIIEFYLNTNVAFNDINAPYIATEVWLLTYFIKVGRKGNANFVIRKDTLTKLESLLQNMQSTFGTGMVTWRQVLHDLDPVKVIASSMARRSGVEIDESDINQLLKAVETKDLGNVESVKNKLNKKYLVEIRKKNANRKKLDKALDKILQYERLAMLSGPGTWVRNWVSNQVIEGSNKLADGMNGKLDKMLSKLFPETKKIKDQYKIAGTKVSNEVSDYIFNNLLNNGLLDMVIEGLNKYDVRKNRAGDTVANVLTEMIAQSIMSHINYQHLSDNKIVTKVEDFIRKSISDDKSVKKAAIRYLGKMITEDLENGRIKSKTEFLSDNMISHDFFTYVAEAYKLASYDYMHKSNVLTQMESAIARKSTGAYFMYKQLFPFMGASWNWFVEGLNYTPIGLAKSIVNFAKLEKTIEKMDKYRQTFAYNDTGISSDFAKYLTLRNISKGLIGSVGFGIGALLVAFGVAKIDEEDEKYKLTVGDNVYVDISDLFGTQGIFLGIAITGSISKKESAGDVFVAALDQLFLDSTFSDVFNNFRYSTSIGDWFAYQPYAMLNMTIPNFIKTISSMITPYNVKYSDGIKGKAEKLLVNSLPGISYAFPHYYDPYTGEKQISQKLWGLTNIVDRLTPFGLSVYNVSDLEKLAIEYGVNKGQLTGKYTINEESINLSSSEIEKLNQFYGKLNVSSFKELQSNKIVYKIQQKDGSYKKVRWQQMTDKEKAAIISRIMTNNSGIAKIYSLTGSGKYKYYASESEYKEFKSLGITKNVYKKSGENVGFVKIN